MRGRLRECKVYVGFNDWFECKLKKPLSLTSGCPFVTLALVDMTRKGTKTEPRPDTDNGCDQEHMRADPGEVG